MTDTAASPAAKPARSSSERGSGPPETPHLRGPDVSFPVGGKHRDLAKGAMRAVRRYRMAAIATG